MNSNKTTILFIGSAVFIVGSLSAASYYWTNKMIKADTALKTDASQQTISSSKNNIEKTPQPELAQSTAPLKQGYSLVAYPLRNSPVYKELDKDCFDPYWTTDIDMRLVKNSTILIPSLIQRLSLASNEKPTCGMNVHVFAMPTDGENVYLTTSLANPTDMPAPQFSALYRLNLTTLTIEQLTLSQFGYPSSLGQSYEVLSDGKRVVSWDDETVDLINLETDSSVRLFTAAAGQWLVSEVGFGMGPIKTFDVQINGATIALGIYSKTQTQDGKTFTNMELVTDRDNLKPKFIKRITISIQSNQAQMSFDGCGLVTQYAKNDWYASFGQALQSNGINLKDISDVCLSKDGSAVLAMAQSDYCGAPNIFEFQTDSSSLQKATVVDKGRGCLASPTAFGKREGNVIHLEGHGGDAGCGSTMYFDYDFVANTVTLKKEFNICEGDKVGHWTNY